MSLGKTFSTSNGRILYCMQHSLKQHPAEEKLCELTQKERGRMMMGDPTELQLIKNILKSKNASRILDVGTFSGCSALAWALTVPDDGQVYTFDVDHSTFNRIGKPCAIQAGVINKIILKSGPADQGLKALVNEGQGGTFDMMFIDADKSSYDNYYEMGLKLLKSGAFIAVDNAVWNDAVLAPDSEQDVDTKAIHALNMKIHADDRVYSTLLPIADGLHLAFKK